MTLNRYVVPFFVAPLLTVLAWVVIMIIELKVLASATKPTTVSAWYLPLVFGAIGLGWWLYNESAPILQWIASACAFCVATILMFFVVVASVMPALDAALGCTIGFCEL